MKITSWNSLNNNNFGDIKIWPRVVGCCSLTHFILLIKKLLSINNKSPVLPSILPFPHARSFKLLYIMLKFCLLWMLTWFGFFLGAKGVDTVQIKSYGTSIIRNAYSNVLFFWILPYQYFSIQLLFV